MKKNYRRLDINEAIENVYFDEDTINERNYFDLLCFYYQQRNMYDIVLTYEGKDLYPIIKKHKYDKDVSGVIQPWEDIINFKYKKTVNKMKRAFLTVAGIGLIGLTAATDADIDARTVQENSRYIIENFTSPNYDTYAYELDLEKVAMYDDYKEPTEETMFKYTNPFYNSKDYHLVANSNYLANSLDNNKIYVYQIDGELYSTTGEFTSFTYEIDGTPLGVVIPQSFESEEEAYEYLDQYIQYHLHVKEYTNLVYEGSKKVKTYNQLPLIYVDKENDNIRLK